MKKSITLILMLLAFLLTYSNASAKKLNAVFSYTTFYSFEDGPYIETYLMVDGKSVEYKLNSNNKFQASIEIMMIFKINDSITNFKKYALLSPETNDTNKIDFSFLDLQRVLLPAGAYDLELHIADMNSENKPFINVEKVNIEFNPSQINISEIQLVESFKKSDNVNILTKAGYDIMPYVINYYPKTIEKITFYAEIYSASQYLGLDEPFIINYYLESWESQQVLGKFSRIKRETSKDVNVIIGELPLKDLPSGNYNLVIELKDKNNQSKGVQKLFFYRSNPELVLNQEEVQDVELNNSFVGRIGSLDTIREYVKSLYPISTEIERVFAETNLKRNDLDMLKKFFYSFWLTRNASNPEQEWQKYAVEVQKVNKSYGTGNRKGYETDRGRVYLQYGAPNSITKSEHEPSAYPYEIWHFYKLRNQSNRRFVFYSREFATNDYELIHSDALGEINDPRWQIKIHKRDTPTHSLDPEDAERHWGGKIHDYYRNPR